MDVNGTLKDQFSLFSIIFPNVKKSYFSLNREKTVKCAVNKILTKLVLVTKEGL